MDKFYYLRGVAPHEAREAIRGNNGRVSSEVANTRRGDDKDRLAFGMNEPGIPGIDSKVVDDFYTEAVFYANMGAYAEAHPGLHRELTRKVTPKYRGFILIYKTDAPLKIHNLNLNYGNRWRTTSELPEGIDRNLFSIFPANPMDNASNFLPFSDKDYGLSERITIEQFDILNNLINKR